MQRSVGILEVIGFELTLWCCRRSSTHLQTGRESRKVAAKPAERLVFKPTYEDFTLPPLFQSDSTGLWWTPARPRMAERQARVSTTIGLYSHAFARKAAG